MKKGWLLAVASLTVLCFGLDAFAAPVESKFDIKIGGYLKLDYIHQDAALGPLSNTVTRANENRDESIFTARQSRVNLLITGPEYMGAKTRAFVEGDFFGPGGSNSSGNFRMRHANFTLEWEEKGTQVLFGQFWDIFAPFAASTLDFDTGGNIGAPSNPRVAQARVTKKFNLNQNNSVTLIAGVQDPAQDPEDAEANFAGQIMFNSKALGVSPGYWGLPMQPLTAGVFGLYGQRKTPAIAATATTPAISPQEIDMWGAGFFTHVPVLRSKDGKSRAGTLTFEGQAYVAEGLSFGGMRATTYRNIGTGLDVDAAKGYGTIGQLIFYPTQPLGITAGYGRKGIMDSAEYRLRGAQPTFPGDPAGAIQKFNDAYWANVTYDFNHVRFGLEYMHMETHYLGAFAEPDANRFQFSAIYFF